MQFPVPFSFPAGIVESNKQGGWQGQHVQGRWGLGWVICLSLHSSAIDPPFQDSRQGEPLGNRTLDERHRFRLSSDLPERNMGDGLDPTLRLIDDSTERNLRTQWALSRLQI